MNQLIRTDKKHYRQTRAQINLSYLRHNLALLESRISTGKLLPVVKADAYGHGATEVAHVLSESVDILAVAFLDEAIGLRGSGIGNTILIMEGVYSQSEFALCHQHNFIPVIHSSQQIHCYQLTQQSVRPHVWVKLDIGMHRLGFMPQEIENAWHKITELSPSAPVLMSHFSDADNGDSDITPTQANVFYQVQKQFGCLSSLTNSPAISQFDMAHGDWNRVGIALYGIAESGWAKPVTDLKPIMSLTAPVLALRQIASGETVGYGSTWQAKRTSTIATIAIGYADGYPRHAPSGTPIWINGQLAPLAGRVSMDMITVDVTECTGVEIGTSVELWGHNLLANTVAHHCGTIPYELVTRVGRRVPRCYINE